MTAIAIDAPRSRVNFWESWPAWSKLSFFLGSSIVSNPHLSILVPRLTHPDLGRCHRSHGQVLQSQTNQEASSNSGCRNWRHDTKKRPRSAIRYPCHRGGLPNRRSVEFESCDTFTSTQHPPNPNNVRASMHHANTSNRYIGSTPWGRKRQCVLLLRGTCMRDFGGTGGTLHT